MWRPNEGAILHHPLHGPTHQATPHLLLGRQVELVNVRRRAQCQLTILEGRDIDHSCHGDSIKRWRIEHSYTHIRVTEILPVRAPTLLPVSHVF